MPPFPGEPRDSFASNLPPDAWIRRSKRRPIRGSSTSRSLSFRAWRQKASGPEPRSLAAAILAYRESDRFQVLAQSTKTRYDHAQNNLSDKLGHFRALSGGAWFVRRQRLPRPSRVMPSRPSRSCALSASAPVIWARSTSIQRRGCGSRLVYRAQQFDSWSDDQLDLFLDHAAARADAVTNISAQLENEQGRPVSRRSKRVPAAGHYAESSASRIAQKRHHPSSRSQLQRRRSHGGHGPEGTHGQALCGKAAQTGIGQKCNLETQGSDAQSPTKSERFREKVSNADSRCRRTY